MLPLLLETLCEKLKTQFDTTEPLVWVNDQPTEDDLDHILKQANDASPFDPLGLRKKTLEDLKLNKARLITKRCEYAKILAIVYPTTTEQIPWDLFAKIFQAFHKPKAQGKSKGQSIGQWRLVWFANPTKRLFPPFPSKPEASHVNGGYASRCLPDTIVIYREEEVARVLIHELLHAACTDNMEDPVELIEAKTETWAELFLVAILANAKPRKTLSLWKVQSQWIADQEYILTRDYGVIGPSDYAWRYTVGRRKVLEGLGIDLPMAKPSKQSELSLRFTNPSLCL